MKKPRHTVSDHALLRYLERAHGVDFEQLRRELGRRIDAAVDGHDGAIAVNMDGLTFRIAENHVVTTCWPRSVPERGQCGPARSRDRE